MKMKTMIHKKEKFLTIIHKKNNILLTMSILADKFINIFVKADLSKIYPITVSFYGEKK